MSSLPMETQRPRAKSAFSHNYTNIELHACLDEAKVHKQYGLSYLGRSSAISPKINLKIMCWSLRKDIIRGNRG